MRPKKLPTFRDAISDIETARHELASSYDSAEALLNAHGIISALALALVVGAQYLTTPVEHARIDFHSLICCYGDFRQYVANVMHNEDVGKYQKEPFNFIAPSFTNTTFNISQELLGSWHFDDTQVRGDRSTMLACFSDPSVASVVVLLIDDFPVKLMRHWMLQHPVIAGKPLYTYQLSSEWHLAMASGLLLGGLVFSLFQYVGLALGTARTDKSGAGLKGWFYVNFAGLVVDYVFLIVGLVLAFIGQSRYIVAKSIGFKVSWHVNVIVAMYEIAVPLAITGLVVMFVSVVVTVLCTARSQEAGNETNQVSDDEENGEVSEDGEGTTDRLLKPLV